MYLEYLLLIYYLMINIIYFTLKKELCNFMVCLVGWKYSGEKRKR
jgi:hypothetical protein